MGASKEYYLNYFRQSGGCCDKIVNGQCIRHSCRQAPLPPGKMCSIEFVRAAVLLRQQIERVEEERRACRREWDQLKARAPDDQRQANHSDDLIRFDQIFDSNSYFFAGSGREQADPEKQDAPFVSGAPASARRAAEPPGMQHADRERGVPFADGEPAAAKNRDPGAVKNREHSGEPDVIGRARFSSQQVIKIKSARTFVEAPTSARLAVFRTHACSHRV